MCKCLEEFKAENIKKRWEKGNTVVDTVVLPTNIPSENENINVNKSINETISVLEERDRQQKEQEK